MAAIQIDDFDRQLIAALTRNARLSNIELAQQVPLSHSAISRRIRRLEDDGVLMGYTASVNRAALGLGVRAFAGLARDNATSLDDICAALKGLDEVASCWIVTGDHDIMIEVLARDLDHFAEIMLRKVQKVPGVAATRSTFVMTEIKQR
jgi:Lrp/AsnC family transcriptional regulator, leucine-responsive regulatory protein